MKLVEKLMEEGAELNITGNGGTHYNGVKIVEVWDDFITIQVGDTGVRQSGQFRGGATHVNITTITRIELASVGPQGNIQDSIRRSIGK